MKIVQKFNKICSYQEDNFKKWFGDMEYENKESKLYSKKLEKSMLDDEIFNELKPTELTLGEVYNYLITDANKKNMLLFYCQDINDVLRAVRVFWDDDGWRIDALSVEDPRRWCGGHQMFSRISFDTKNLILKDSDVLTLEKCVEYLKKMMEKVNNMLILK